MPKIRITDASLKAAKPNAPVWDTEVQGFGARRRVAGGDVTFVFKYRSPVERDSSGRGVQRILTIGRWGRGDWAIDTAREEATKFRDHVRLGRDPASERDEAAKALTVAELADAYLRAIPQLLLRGAGRAKKPSTVATDRSRIEAHIKPLLGKKFADKLTTREVDVFMHQVAAGKTARDQGKQTPVKGGKGAATRTVGLLGAIFTYGIRIGVREDNPTKGVVKFAYEKRKRRVSDDEYRALGEGLKTAATVGVSPTGIAATRLLLLTGWRLSEATQLRWAEVDAARRTARLGDTKTGLSIRPLSWEALAVIQAQPATGSPFVFPAAGGATGLQGLPKQWRRIRKLAGLPGDITLHTLRHSFASVAADLGYSQATVGGLIGHKQGGTTEGYMHVADAVLLAAADKVARRTVELVQGPQEAAAKVVPMLRPSA